MNVYDVCGFFYTDDALNWLMANEMATKTDTGVEVWTQPMEWDRYTTFDHWNPDRVDIYIRKHFENSVQDVQWEISGLGLTWVEPPAITQYDEGQANYLTMLKIGAPMLPGIEA